MIHIGLGLYIVIDPIVDATEITQRCPIQRNVERRQGLGVTDPLIGLTELNPSNRRCRGDAPDQSHAHGRIGRLEGVPKQRHGGAHKNMALTLVERGGSTRSFHIGSASVAEIVPCRAPEYPPRKHPHDR